MSRSAVGQRGVTVGLRTADAGTSACDCTVAAAAAADSVAALLRVEEAGPCVFRAGGGVRGNVILLMVH